MASKRKRTRRERNRNMTFLGIFLGVVCALVIGTIIYVLNQQNRFD